MLSLFRDLRKSYSKLPVRQAWCSYLIALGYWRFFNNEDAAYNELNKTYDQFYGPEGSDLTRSFSYDDAYFITTMTQASTLLAEIVFIKIHSSPVKCIKSLLIHDLEKVFASTMME